MVRIGEAHVIEGHRADGPALAGGLFTLVRQFLIFQEVENAGCGGGNALQGGHALRDLRERRGEHPGVEDERHDHAEPDLAAQHEDRAEDADGDVGEVPDDHHDGLHHAGNELALPVGVVDVVVQAAEAVPDLPLRAGGAHDLVAGVHFLDVAVQGAEVLLPRHEVFLAVLQEDQGDGKAQKGQQDQGAGHADLDDQHHHEAAHELDERAQHAGQAVREALLHGRDVVRDAAQDIALRIAGEIDHRHAVDLGVEVAAHLFRNAEGRRGHHVLLQHGQGRAAEVDGEQEEADLRDGGHVDGGLEAVLHDVGHVAEQARADDGKDGGACRADHREDDERQIFLHVAEGLAEGGSDLDGLIQRSHVSHGGHLRHLLT